MTAPRLPRSLACVLALAAASTAHAQPAGSVQVYGIVDLALARLDGPATGVSATVATNSTILNGGLSTSRWGLRGNEDLGGGLTASFDLSGFFQPQTGQSGRSQAVGTIAADPFWSRVAFVSLEHKDFGRVRLGNVTTLLFVNSISSNAFGDSTTLSPLNLVTFFGSPLSGGTGWSNQILIDGPKLFNVTLQAAISASDGQNGRNHAWRAAWSDGPAAVSFVSQSVRKDPSTFADGLSANDTKAWQLAASYDFKVVKVWAHLGRIQNNGTAASPQDASHRIWDVSASVPLGAGRVVAGYASRSTDDTVSPVPSAAPGGNVERQIASVGYIHSMSKRTDLYGIVMHDQTSTRTVGVPPTIVDASGTSVAVGIRHNF